MEEIAISKFKATCLAVLERVRKTRKPIRVTRSGQPVVDVVPPVAPKHRRRRVGTMVGTGRITGNIISPAAGETDWKILRS